MTLSYGEVTQNGYGYSSILRAIERLLLMRSGVLPRQYDANFEGITRALWDLGSALEGAIPPPAISSAGPMPPFWDATAGDYMPGGEPGDGSFWFDTRQGRLFIAMDGEWHQTNGAESFVHAGPNPPPRETPGVLWFDTRQGACFIYLDAVTAGGEGGWYQLNGGEGGTVDGALIELPDATTAAKGVVQLADEAAITAGTAGRVVDAAQLSAAIADVDVVVSDATTTSKGIVQLADAAAITAGTAGRVVDAAQLQAIVIAGAPDATTTGKGVVQLADAAAIGAGTAERVVDAAQLKAISDAAAGKLEEVAGTAPIQVTGSGTSRTVAISEATTSAAGSMSAADKIKLDGIAAGAEVNVNADWNASSGDAQILNKPTIPAAADTAPQPLGTAAVGISADYAREDHVHALPSAATTSTDGLMTAVDRVKLNAAVVSDTTGITGADVVTNIVRLTQAEYDAILEPSVTTFYVITEDSGGSGGGESDPDFANVSLLLHMDGSNGSTTFTDDSSNSFTVSVFGGAQITTTNPKFGAGALTLDGNGDYLTLPADSAFQFGTGDFTVECWVYVNPGNTNQGLFTFGGISSGLAVAVIAGTWRLSTAGAGGAEMGSVATEEWQHLAVCRSGTSLRMFINGTQLGSTQTNSTNLTDDQLKIGYYYSTYYAITAKIDEFRVTKVARYAADFTPPTAPFPNQ